MSNKTDEMFMREAIKICEKGINKGQSPFGAVIVCNGNIIAKGHNQVWKNTDVTAHAEIITIRKANKKVKDIYLKGCTLYSTTEPCPMCFSAIHWAGIDKVVYGASISDSKNKLGFNELTISNREMKRFGKSKVKVTSDILKDECVAQLLRWKTLQNHKNY